MISANEAREKTEAVRNNGVERELERIEHEIEEAIRNGDNNIALDGTISHPTANLCGNWDMRYTLAVSTTNRILQSSGKVSITWA